MPTQPKPVAEKSRGGGRGKGGGGAEEMRETDRQKNRQTGKQAGTQTNQFMETDTYIKLFRKRPTNAGTF